MAASSAACHKDSPGSSRRPTFLARRDAIVCWMSVRHHVCRSVCSTDA